MAKTSSAVKTAIESVRLEQQHTEAESALKRDEFSPVTPITMERNVPQVTTQINVTHVPLDAILPDPNQPRQHYTTKDEMEFLQSIEEMEVMEPICIRQYPDLPSKYMIVYGERRYRASLAVKAKIPGRDTIPAIIRELTDAEALAIQLVENLQRKNVHPMEEAVSFLALVQQSGHDVEEIAARVGKSVYFIRQRLKLNDLSTDWQKMFRKDGITLSIALDICVLAPKIQQVLYDDRVTKENEMEESPEIYIEKRHIENFNGNLLGAGFSLTDETIDVKAGACSGCPFNSAMNSLFPDQANNPSCSNITCFKNKKEIHYFRELEIAKADPSVILIYESYHRPQIVEILKKDGHDVLKEGFGEQCKITTEPEVRSWDSFNKSRQWMKKNDKELKKLYQEEVAETNAKIQVYKRDLETAKIKKAFVVHSNDSKHGKYVYITINAKTKKINAKEVIANGSAGVDDLNNEIARLKEKEIRNKELDQEKVHKRITDALKESKLFTEIPKTTNANDNVLINYLLSKMINMSLPDDKYKKIPVLSSAKLPAKRYVDIGSLTKQQVAFIARQILLDRYSGYLADTEPAYMIRKTAEAMPDIPIAEFEAEQQVVAQKRQARLKERISELQQQKKNLEKPAPAIPSAKKRTNEKPTTKKAA